MSNTYRENFVDSLFKDFKKSFIKSVKDNYNYKEFVAVESSYAKSIDYLLSKPIRSNDSVIVIDVEHLGIDNLAKFIKEFIKDFFNKSFFTFEQCLYTEYINLQLYSKKIKSVCLYLHKRNYSFRRDYFFINCFLFSENLTNKNLICKKESLKLNYYDAKKFDIVEYLNYKGFSYVSDSDKNYLEYLDKFLSFYDVSKMSDNSKSITFSKLKLDKYRNVYKVTSYYPLLKEFTFEVFIKNLSPVI